MKMELIDNKLKILQFTDTHFGNMPFTEDDEKTFILIDRIINQEKPDFIVHTGDIMWSEGVKDADIVFIKVMKYFDKYKIPMAITFGNHDAEEGVTKRQLKEIFNDNVEHRAKKDDVFSANDKECYTVGIYNNNERISNLFFLDSGADDKYKFGIYDWNEPEQVEWFRKVSEKYKKNDGVRRNIVFQHIPLPEYWESKENILDGKCMETDEVISSPHINTGLFSNMLLNGETWGIVVGHDHDNNFDSLLHGIHLTYGNVSGYQTYGQLKRGARVIEISDDPFEIKTRTIDIDL